MSKHTITSLIAAGGLVAVAVALAAAPKESPIRITTGKSAVTIRAGGGDLLTYRYRDVPFKPYVQQLFSPKGVGILRDAPHDHLHHHALMFAIAVDGVDFWSEGKTAGRQVHKSFANAPADRSGGKLRTGFTELLDWVGPKGRGVLLTERRTIEASGAGADASLLTWRSRLELPPGKKTAKVTGSHYFGLGMRFLKSMDTGGRFENAAGKAGKVVRGTEKLARATWCAYFAKADGKAVTAAMFDHPDNPRHPATWFTMTKPFAYLSATLALRKEPLTLEPGKPLVVRYGVAVWDGHVKRDLIEKAYKQWSAGPARRRHTARRIWPITPRRL
ncbi:MAG: PmoA family protein [Phycisphaerae bacterium]|nr:PmoA family protein [Phycisphaerae bacterium]